MKTNDGDDFRDVYYVLFVTPDTWVSCYTMPIYSRRRAEEHADWLIAQGFNQVKVVREV